MKVPARAAAAAAVARALAGLPPHQRIALPSSSENLVSIYGSNPQGQKVEELEDDFYQEVPPVLSLSVCLSHTHTLKHRHIRVYTDFGSFFCFLRCFKWHF